MAGFQSEEERREVAVDLTSLVFNFLANNA